MRRSFDLRNMCWVCEDPPKEINVTFIAPICKKREKWSNENYRGVSPVHSEYKMCWNVIMSRIRFLTECMLDGPQDGFRKFCKWETRGIQLTGCSCFVVYEKAFDKFTEISFGQVTIDKNLLRMLHISCTIAINNKKLEKETKKIRNE